MNKEHNQKQNSALLCNYTLGKTIGRGTFGKVKKAIHKRTGEPVAVKILEKDKIKDITDVQRVARELHILKIVRHAVIAQLYEIIETHNYICIIMEYAAGGQFFDYVMDGHVKSEAEAHIFMVQIIEGLSYLHLRCGIAHRDIKPENILLDTNHSVKIVDFGLSNMYSKNEKLVTACGSPCYASPEMIKGQKYDPELSDVWSLGIVLYSMIFAKLPFEDDNTSVLYSKIKSGMYILHKKISPELKDLLQKLINVIPEHRIGLKNIKNHPWLKLYPSSSIHGISVGYQIIPVDMAVVQKIDGCGSPQQILKYLQSNIKNEATTTYYLHLKKVHKLGRPSHFDICSQSFDKKLIISPRLPKRHKSMDFQFLINMISSEDKYGETLARKRNYASQHKYSLAAEDQRFGLRTKPRVSPHRQGDRPNLRLLKAKGQREIGKSKTDKKLNCFGIPDNATRFGNWKSNHPNMQFVFRRSHSSHSKQPISPALKNQQKKLESKSRYRRQRKDRIDRLKTDYMHQQASHEIRVQPQRNCNYSVSINREKMLENSQGLFWKKKVMDSKTQGNTSGIAVPRLLQNKEKGKSACGGTGSVRKGTQDKDNRVGRDRRKGRYY